MTPQDVCDIISRVTYKPGWSVLMGFDQERTFIQLEVSIESDATLDSEKRDGSRTPWKSAKRYLSPHMCRQEVVGVIFGLIQDAEMHEVREWFRYRGASIFNPHLDPDVLAQVARKKSSFNVRENAMSMAEPSRFDMSDNAGLRGAAQQAHDSHRASVTIRETERWRLSHGDLVQ